MKLSLLLLTWSLSAALAAPSLRAVRAEVPPAIDGDLSDPAWQTVPWTGGMVDAQQSASAGGGRTPAAVQTRFKVLYDADHLYVAAECDEPKIESLKAAATEHDGLIYLDDCVEIFFDPAGEGRYYHHFIVNTNGAWYDDYGADYGLVHVKFWDVPLAVGTRVDPAAKQWRAEVAIPLATLQLRDDAGADWLFNLTRERYAGGQQELTSWSPLLGNFHSPKEFGRLTGVEVDYRPFRLALSEPRVAVARAASGARAVRLELELANLSGQDRALTVVAAPFLAALAGTEPASVRLAAGATQSVALPPLQLPARFTGPVQLTVRDGDRPVAIAVKRLDTEYRPLALEILEPVYRNSIYATQNVPRLVFQITLAPDIAAAAKTVRSRLLGKAEMARDDSPIAALGEPRSLAIETLPVGDYRLLAEAVDAAGQVVASHETSLRKLPAPAGNEVRVDEVGNILVNGQPTVFIGWYGGIPDDDPRPEVVRLQNVTTPVVLSGPNPDTVRGLWERGVYSIVSIEPGRLFYTFELWRDPANTIRREESTLDEPSEATKDLLRQVVAAVKDEPGLLGYYLADEPEIHDTRSDYLENYHKFMMELDPYHPVMITNDTLDGIVSHGYKACDILNPDPYSPAWDYVPNFLHRANQVAPRGKGLMLTPWHSSSQAHFNHDWGTAPPYSYRVMRNQMLVAVALGARGFTGYTSAFFLPEPLLREGLPPIWREIRWLEPAMAAAPQPIEVTSDLPLAAWARQANGEIYLLLVNHKPGSREATIRSPLLEGITELHVVRENRRVKPIGGAFTETFAEGDARIYTTDPSGLDFPANDQVEQAITGFEQAGIRPGNLLHFSRGVRARASAGYYAPWFDQFYYYAINGILDDPGWYASHTTEPDPWLELTLPKPTTIGRVRMVSPNLADYDLVFTGADGSVQIAAVRGSDEEVAEHRLNPPVSALKLRIIAKQVRDGGTPAKAMVREIEAYADSDGGRPVPVTAQTAAAQPIEYTPPAAESGGPQVLWREDFETFAPAEKFNWDGKDTTWVVRPDSLRTSAADGRVSISSPSGEHKPMTHFYPMNPDYRWFQVKLDAIEGAGYKFTTVQLSNSAGKPGYRQGVNTARPGIYTVDTWAIHEAYRTGEDQQAMVNIYVGAPTFTFDWLQLVRRPENGLAVTLADGSPLPASLKQGDALLYRLFLAEPATDAVVEVSAGPNYTPLPINGEPYVPLRKTGAGDGREWIGTVTLGPGTGKHEASAYPVQFRAVITGGTITETYAPAAVGVE